jgi:glutathione peroxidase
MKLIALVTVLLSACLGMNEVRKPNSNMTANPATSFYNFKLNSLEGDPIDFTRYKGKKVLLVNVASRCGYTPQYKQLQQLHEKYGSKVVILGFPANNFGRQEPGNNAEIKEFCQKNYGVSFQMFEKISVTGDDQHPLYKWLSNKTENGWNDQAPKWNFCKYLVNEKGELVRFYASGVDPMSEELLKDINS